MFEVCAQKNKMLIDFLAIIRFVSQLYILNNINIVCTIKVLYDKPILP